MCTTTVCFPFTAKLAVAVKIVVVVVVAAEVVKSHNRLWEPTTAAAVVQL